MVYRSPFLLILVATVIGGCFSATGGRGHSVQNLSIGSCNPNPCARVTIETLPELPSTFSEEARAQVVRKVEEVLFAPLNEQDGEPSRANLIAGVQAQYDEYLREKEPEVVVDWTIERVATLLYTNGEIASVAVRNRGYLGGAHGFDEERLLVFDAKSGRALAWDDIISSQSRPIFTKAAEAEFKRARGLPSDRSLTEEGFTFEGNESFGLPINFALTEKGIVCHYNPYEVGPYVMGSTDFTVPMDVVKPALTAEATALLGTTEPRQGLL